MALSDEAVSKQLRHMIAFMEQEANEKAEELDAKAEEEFNIEKSRIIRSERGKLEEVFQKRCRQLELQRKIEKSTLMSRSKMEILRTKENHLRTLKSEVLRNMITLTADKARYSTILESLISQASNVFGEPAVTVQCRQSDLGIVEPLLKKLSSSGQVTMTLSDTFLPPKSAGGVVAMSSSGRIKVDNTLDSRLNNVFADHLPYIRSALFGHNPNRKFFR